MARRPNPILACKSKLPLPIGNMKTPVTRTNRKAGTSTTRSTRLCSRARSNSCSRPLPNRARSNSASVRTHPSHKPIETRCRGSRSDFMYEPVACVQTHKRGAKGHSAFAASGLSVGLCMALNSHVVQVFGEQHAVFALPIIVFDDWDTVDGLPGVFGGKTHAMVKRD